jgi:hypothetical protein
VSWSENGVFIEELGKTDGKIKIILTTMNQIAAIENGEQS